MTIASGSDQPNEMIQNFEVIDHQQFGKDRLDDAVTQLSEIESARGLADPAKFTAPSPPPAK